MTEKLVMVRADDLEAAYSAASQCGEYLREKYGYTSEVEQRVGNAFAGKLAVSNERLRELFKEYWALAFKSSVRGVVHHPPLDRIAAYCNEGTDHIAAGNRDEAMRVLGFVQGFFSAHGILGPGDIDRHMGAA